MVTEKNRLTTVNRLFNEMNLLKVEFFRWVAIQTHRLYTFFFYFVLMIEDFIGKPEVEAKRPFDNDGVYECEGAMEFSTQKDRMTTSMVLIVILLLVVTVFGAGILFYGQLESTANISHEESARTRALTDKLHERGQRARGKFYCIGIDFRLGLFRSISQNHHDNMSQ